MSELLRFAEYRLQEVALGVMAFVYALRILWLLRFRAGRDRQAETARGSLPRLRGIVYSWAIIAMPWAMESTRQKWWLYAQFVVFHLGVVAAIGLSFIIPYWPQALDGPGTVLTLQILTGAAGVVGCARMYRRIADPVMRRISSPDDYFSLALLIVWFFLAVGAAPNRPPAGSGPLIAFFVVTAFFLLYVPFSKISHYLYYPFTRYYFGSTMGHRGVYPLQRSPRLRQVTERTTIDPAWRAR